MSSKTDHRYLQIIVCYCDIAQNVARKYAEFTIQKYCKDWKDFLNENMHAIYHLWINNTSCCMCQSAEPAIILKKNRSLTKDQIELLFKIDGPETPNHFQKDREKRIRQQCICKVSVKPSCDLQDIDCSLLRSILRNCEKTKDDYEKCKSYLDDILEVRNEISHAPRTTMNYLSYEELWGKLKNAVLRLAKLIPDQDVYEETKKEIQECEEQRGTLEQIGKGSDYFSLFIQDTVSSALRKSLIGHDEDCSGIQVEGYLELEKRSVFTKLGVKLYNEYWFELRPPGNLQYHKKKPEREGVLPLKNFNILQYAYIETKKEKLFNVVIGDTKLKLRANSAESKEIWIKAINAIQKRQLSQFIPSSNRLSTISNESTMLDDISRIQNKDESKDVVSSEAAEISGSFHDSKKPVRVVAAIDFGTTSSGAAFSTRESFDTDALKIEFIQLDKQKGYQKTQTSVLFNEDGFVAFGEQAEHKFKLLSSKKKDNLYFFKTFKMQLHGGKLSKSTKLRSLAGDKEMSCAIVIAACIEHIKEKVIERIKELNPSIEEEIDIHWVLTVPAIWSEQARQFMIKAAEKAGIERGNLSLALEPECAALHCKHELWKKKGQTDTSSDPFTEGSQFMVVDLGGGTVDITVSEILKEGKIKEISKASGGKWGGNAINKKIIKIFEKIFEQEMPKLRTEKYNVYLKLMADIEEAKRRYDGDDQLMIDIPKPLQDKINLQNVFKTFGNDIEISDENEFIYVSQELATKIFRACISDITKHVKGLLKDAKGVSIIILVGGYASSAVVKKVFEEVFKDKVLLIRPQNPEIAVLTGAVISGHSIDPITGRVAKYNYGIGIKASIDSKEGNVLIADESCVKIFHLLIEKNRKMEVGKYVGSCKIKVDESEHLNAIELYITTEDHPKKEVNSDDFTMIGTIKFNIPKLEQPTIFVVSIRYNETEFRVSAEVENGRHKFEGIIQYF